MPSLRTVLSTSARLGVTLVVLAVAGVAAWKLWTHYQVDPWTRDGRVRADVVQVAPDISGLVTDVAVTNDQPVHRGQLLFVIDRDRYALALRQADATVAAQKAALDEARREAVRNAQLGDLVAAEQAEQSRAKVAQDEAALAQAVASRDVAALNLKRTAVVAPVDGILSDSAVRVGDYVSPGKAVLGLIDASSYRIEGYFEETKLKSVKVGDPVTVRLMGDGRALPGHVISIAAGIEDRDRAQGSSMLPNVNPTFSWVRLAQRVPVRVVLDHPPADLRLIAGRTASVSVRAPSTRPANLKVAEQ